LVCWGWSNSMLSLHNKWPLLPLGSLRKKSWWGQSLGKKKKPRLIAHITRSIINLTIIMTRTRLRIWSRWWSQQHMFNLKLCDFVCLMATTLFKFKPFDFWYGGIDHGVYGGDLLPWSWLMLIHQIFGLFCFLKYALDVLQRLYTLQIR
jgi:hypothetical protein